MSARGHVVQNFMQIHLRGLLGKWVKYTQKFLFIYAFFLQRTHRSDLLRDFYA